MRQRELFDPSPTGNTSVPEAIEAQLIKLLAELMHSTFEETPKEESDEPDQR